MQRGLLTNTYLDGIPAARAASLAEIGLTEERIAKARKLNEIAIRRKQTLAQMAIAWVLRNEKVTSVLVGADRVSHIEDNVAALNNLEFSADELNRIDSILKS
jgi:L-glyceraldehyde 3-phosphate reductase